MQLRRTWILSVVTILATFTAPVAGQAISEKGKATIGVHEIAMKTGNLYMIKVLGQDFFPHVTMKPGNLAFGNPDFTKPNQFLSYYFPSKNETQTIYVLPELFSIKGKGPFEYTIDVAPSKLAAKPILELKGELTATDPPFKADFLKRPHHKAHNIKLEAGRFYIIDMTSPEVQNRLDSYLYLLDNKGKILRSDDDSGGFPNARIVFQPEQSGEYRIITTGLGNALGEFALTVRTTEKE
jgi:hypothetical protein